MAMNYIDSFFLYHKGFIFTVLFLLAVESQKTMSNEMYKHVVALWITEGALEHSPLVLISKPVLDLKHEFILFISVCDTYFIQTSSRQA